MTSNYDGNKYFLTLDSQDTVHKEMLIDICKEEGVKVEFINHNGKKGAETQEIARRSHGALRCQTNILSKMFLTEMEKSAIIIQKKFREYKQHKEFEKIRLNSTNFPMGVKGDKWNDRKYKPLAFIPPKEKEM
ncbi:hypothetical protein [Francisella adeliensis]|uniref:Uncharacterized protein n=1 Tax=Francisella adeliensis TaxID=2007306 RepID=A0A2Z4Y0H3_9GAMM|nr:hypothetical protein [Francisella adeliensis]AXA34564.1 hypothetical protein CDH04_09230 [Francisella adeliensis]MBK2086288.1 hypothetical protein [Francisella adeliensis]MBK2096505.1 hypothetical protein [Francisella adeliensis]QIW12810.1 hypothetical protein FZC43_09245 [Francisella adeliensis]QIW14688.1 hypothetical protein FZC44_09240 [Francisella adeliensis]